MDWAILAGYVGYWRWKVKRHAKPEIFKSLSDGVLQKYANAFGITIDELKTIDRK